MKAVWHRTREALFKTRRQRILLLVLALCAVPALGRLVVLVLWTVPVYGSRSLTAPRLNAPGDITYLHDEVREVPWSMHVIKVHRTRQDLELHSTMGQGVRLGMATVSDQMRMVPRAWGRPVAAINGDLYHKNRNYLGDPFGLQIVHGELVSAPCPDRVCFWIDPAGQPHRSNVLSRFQVTWPEGGATPIGLNEERLSDAAVLYTAAAGASTRTRGGVELVLERQGQGPWLPLRIGVTYQAVVRKVNRQGDSPLSRKVMVLSLGSELARRVPKVEEGAVLTLSTDTVPDLAGAQVAIGGGPSLVVGGKPRRWDGLQFRHPRTALGWNDEYYFLVQVDGRQLRLSLGMTLAELADYMVKLGCQEAMNLDGGGSATCWLYGQVVNSPSEGQERPAANALVLVQTSPRSD